MSAAGDDGNPQGNLLAGGGGAAPAAGGSAALAVIGSVAPLPRHFRIGEKANDFKYWRIEPTVWECIRGNDRSQAAT